MFWRALTQRTRLFSLVVLAVAIPVTSISAQQALTLKNASLAKREFQIKHRHYRFFEWTFPKRKNDDDALVIAAVEAPEGAYDIRIVDVRQDGQIGALLGDLRCADPIVLTNGGFYFQRTDGRRQPTGLVVSNGTLISPLANRPWGGFVTWDGKILAIKRLTDAPAAKKAREALQASPILIWDNKSDLYSDDEILFDRISIGVTNTGGLITIGAFKEEGDAISLFGLAKLADARRSIAIA
jgi:Phosphodiester glycosidase